MATKTLTQVQKPMLGSLLLRKGLISSSDLQEALLVQNHTGKKLGEVLVEKKLVCPDKINRALTEQNVLLGEILIEEGYISPEQLEQVLAEQSIRNKKLGELLVENNLVTQEQLEVTLKKQYWQKNGFWLIS